MPAYSPCERPFAVLFDGDSSGLLFVDGIVQREVTISFRWAEGTYRFIQEDALGIGRLPTPEETSGPRLGLLAVRLISPEDRYRRIELAATIVHEQFHASFQGVPNEDITELSARFPEVTESWSPDLWRSRLEERFRDDLAFRRGLGRELADLIVARTELLDGHEDAAISVLRDFFTSRQRRRDTMRQEEAVYERYWEYIEGTAQMMELEAARALFRVNRYPDLRDAGESLDDSYFLTTGAMISDLLWLLSPERFTRAVRRGKVADLEAALREVLPGSR